MIAMCKKCRACLEFGKRDRNARAGLCWMCRQPDPEQPHRMPAEPTKTLPGSPEKQIVLAMRAANGELLHHPDDISIKLDITELGRAEIFKKSHLPFLTNGIEV